jgi:hypothetical protein
VTAPDFSAHFLSDERGPVDYYIGGAAADWRAANEDAKACRAHLVALVREAQSQGVSEYAIAAAAGVTRNTVRSWLGKGGA